MAARPNVLGVVLSGGLSRRMGKVDKAFLDLSGTPLLGRVLERIDGQVDSTILSVNGDRSRYERFGLPIVADTVRDAGNRPAGPLAGVLTAIDWARDRSTDVAWVVSVPVDTPFLPADLVARLVAAGQENGSNVVCAASGGQVHPVVAAWSVGCRDRLYRALYTDRRYKVDDVAVSLGRTTVDWLIEGVDPFMNVNRPDDLARALADIGGER